MTAAQTSWTDVIVAALAAAGVEECVVSPGSRSAPLATALARAQRPRATVIVDERAAGFYALGAARASGRPVALLCTSGSAPGHYLPAVIEAAMAEVPLVVISADRPPELQDAGAAQTITQPRLFGEQVRMHADLGPPAVEPMALRAVRRRVIQAVTAARGPVPGPVHLNVPLRKPLEPAAPRTELELALAAEARRLATAAPPLAPPRLAPTPDTIEELAAAIAAEPRGLFVVGAMPETFAAAPREPSGLADARAELFALVERAGYPLWAEAGSGLRLGPRPAGLTAIDDGDLIFAAGGAAVLAPRLVVQLGAEPIAAGWHAALPELAAADRWTIARRWQDPSAMARVVLAEPALAISALARALERRAIAPRPSSYLAAWRDWQARALAARAEAIAELPGTEVSVVGAALAAACQGGARVLLGNSLPIRVADWIPVAPTSARWTSVATQRGASGIDGAIAAACGAAADGTATLLLIGDVTFAHDVGSLAVAAHARGPLAIVVIDNGGGRIFDHLPVARAGLPADDYQRFFTTAPRLDPVAIARGFGVRAHRAEGAALTDLLAEALTCPGATLLHAPVADDGARMVRARALAALAPPLRMVQGASS